MVPPVTTQHTETKGHTMSESATRVNMNAFKDCVLFSVTIRQWGNRAQVKNPAALEEYYRLLRLGQLAQMQSGDAPATDGLPLVTPTSTRTSQRVSATKRLVKSDALDTLAEHLRNVKAQALKYSMPSFIRSGMFVVHRKNVLAVQEILQAGQRNMEDNFLPEFLSEYPLKRDEAQELPVERGGLGPLFDGKDYPPTPEVAKKFAVRWNWLSIDVAEGIPEELRAQETEKLRQQFTDASQQIRDALRTMFAEIIEHAVDRLKTEPGEKPKVFRDSLLDNMNEFFATFEARNIMGDEQLTEIVAKAKAVMQGRNSKQLRTDLDERNATAKALSEVKAYTDAMVTEIRTRAFDFTEE
jgi:hypothetical protein